MTKLYLIGSLKNPEIPKIAKGLRNLNFEVFDEWYAAGPEADDYWRDYENFNGHSYAQALKGYPAKHVFTFDQFHLNCAHSGILVYPAGKSGHLELGFLSGQKKPCFILLDKIPDRFDVMKQFAQNIYTNIENLIEDLSNYPWPKFPEMPILYQHQIMWLAGLLEGEGSFCISKNTPRLCLQMTDPDIVEQAADILKSSVWSSKRLTKGDKRVYACGKAGLSAIEWMRILKPYLGIRRQQQITTTVSIWLENRKYNSKDNSFWATMFGIK